jgi:hypothetical protein
MSSADKHDLNEALAHLHRLVLTYNGNAIDDITRVLLRRLVRRLQWENPRVDIAILEEASEDAVIRYLASPGAYDPARSRLDTYVLADARLRILNRKRSDRRRRRLEQRYRLLGYWQTIDAPTTHDTSGSPPLVPRFLGYIVRSDVERDFLRARAAGERRTDALAQIIGVSDMPVSQQRRAVKRMADRLVARLRRAAGAERGCHGQA